MTSTRVAQVVSLACAHHIPCVILMRSFCVFDSLRLLHFSSLCCLSSLVSSCLSSWPSTSSSTMWWTNSLCTSANEDLGTLAEYDPLTECVGVCCLRYALQRGLGPSSAATDSVVAWPIVWQLSTSTLFRSVLPPRAAVWASPLGLCQLWFTAVLVWVRECDQRWCAPVLDLPRERCGLSKRRMSPATMLPLSVIVRF